MFSNFARVSLVALLAAAAFAGYRYAYHAQAQSSEPQIRRTLLAPPLVGATYHGGNWPKNFINAFRRQDVAADFARFSADGYNTVVLLVSWGDFQPVYEPCCQYDERAFERLGFLIDRAREAGLDVALRIGYGWTFHPGAGGVGERTLRLLNEASVRAAFFAYVTRIADVVRRHANVRLVLLSWEDLILERIESREDFLRFVQQLPAGGRLRAMAGDGRKLPPRTGEGTALFNAYWDWLLMQQIFRPASERIPELSWEARIDREPSLHVNALGETTYDWIGHETTYRPPGADTLALYWAPFWGARNEGEKLDAAQALHLFNALLSDVRQHSGGLPMFIDQLNVIDNTLGFERNATLQESALPAFMDGAFCAMRNAGVFGYAYWTTQDYAESPLFNPSFGYGLDGWHLITADGSDPERHLIKQPSNDFSLRLAAGDVLRQSIPARRGRLPTTSAEAHLAVKICVTAHAGEAASVEAMAGAAPVQLTISSAVERVCSSIATRAKDSNLELKIRGVSGRVDLTGVQLFDHVQEGGLYGIDGKEGVLLPQLRKLNERFARQPGAADRCQQISPADH